MVSHKHTLDLMQRIHEGKIRILNKKTSWMGWFLGVCCAVLHYCVTFGQAGWNFHKTCFVFGRWIVVVPEFDSWDEKRKLRLLLHEYAHINHAYLNQPDLLFQNLSQNDTTKQELSHFETNFFTRLLHYIKYFIYPLPFKKASYRAKVEFWGFLQTYRVIWLERGYLGQQDKKWLVEIFSCASYAWMLSQEEAEEMADLIIQTVKEDAAQKDPSFARRVWGG